MNKYGLTEKEKEIHLQKYNHALFKNSMSFLDIVWEINMLAGTVVILDDKADPTRNLIEFQYEEFYQDYIAYRILEKDIHEFKANMAFDKLKEMRDEVAFYTHMLAPDGQWHLHRIVLTPALDEEDQLYCVYMGALNMHEEELRELEMFRRQEQFREAMMSNSYFCFEFDVTAGGIITDDFVARDGSHPIKDATGIDGPVPYHVWVDKWYELYEPEFDKQQEKNIFNVDYFKRAFERNERVLDVEVKQKSQDGSGGIEFMHIFVILLENPVDRHIHACIIWRDISAFRSGVIEKKMKLMKKNKALKRTVSQEEQFRQAFLSGAIMVYSINLTRNQIESEFYEIIDGESYPMLQLVGLEAPCNFETFCKRWVESKVSEDSKETFLQMYNRQYLLDAYNRGEYHLEIEFDTVIGRGIPVTLRNTVLLLKDNASGNILALVNSKDVTKQRREEHDKREALREAYEAANRANSAKSDFLARMSHDIRTPMNAIVGMTAIAKAYLDDVDRVEDCLDKITISSRHLLGLINEVLDMSKIESGKIELQEEAFFLPELIDSLLAICRPQLKAKNHKFDVSVHEIQNEHVIGDSQRIQQVLMNLMSNAVKYTQRGGKISLFITEKQTNNPRVGCYEFVLEDNGIGMSREFQEHLFEPFERAQDSRASHEQGTGLGMSITKNIVQMMNGTINVESELNKGTKFTVTIFLKIQNYVDEANASNATSGSVLEELEELGFGGRRALIVEDNEINAEIAMEILKMTGLEVEWLEDGSKALEKMKQVQDGYYDVIFMDILMPVMNGYEAVKAIRALDSEYARSVPIIAMSANAFAEDVQQAKASGMNDHLAKPINFEKLRKALNEWVNRGEESA